MFGRNKKNKQKIEMPDTTEQPTEMIMHNTSELVGYPNKEVQLSIYEFASKYISSDSTVLDLGAGIGDYYKYLEASRPPGAKDVLYTGIEFLPSLVDLALTNNNVKLKLGSWDVLEDELPTVDWVVNILSLTVLPHGLSERDNFYNYIEDHLRLMYKHCNTGASFTFIRPSNITDLHDYKTIDLNFITKFCEANNFLYIIDCSYNDYVTNLTIFKQ